MSNAKPAQSALSPALIDANLKHRASAAKSAKVPTQHELDVAHPARAPPGSKPLSARWLDRRRLLAKLPLSYPSIWKLMRNGAFPRPVVVGRKNFWSEAAVDDWITSHPVQQYTGYAASADDNGERLTALIKRTADKQV